MEYLRRSIDFDDPVTASTFDELSLWSSRFGALLLEHLPLQPDITILDLGCGLGFPLFELAYAHGPSCRVVGVDIWRAALLRAGLKQRIFGSTNVSLNQADGARLPFAPATFDLIVSNLGINNFADPPATLLECARVVRPGGRLVLTTNVKGHMAKFYTVYRDVLNDLNLTGYLAPLQEQEDHRLTHTDVVAMLQTAGFSVVRTVEEFFPLRYFDGSAFLRHWFIIAGFLGGWRGFLDQEDEPDIFAALEDRLNTVATVEGELHLTIPMLYLEAQIDS